MKLKLLLLTSLLVSTLLAQNDDAPPTFEEAPPQDWPAPEAQNDPEKTYEMFDIAKAPLVPWWRTGYDAIHQRQPKIPGIGT
jgi:hypothetical protein